MSELKDQAKTFKLNQKQDEFVFSKNKYPVFKGTWGCGKSLAALLAVCLECQDNPGNLYLIIRNEWVDLRDSTIKDWNDLFPALQVTSGDAVFSNGSRVMFRHGRDLNALKNANLGGCLMVQAEEMTEEDFWFINGRLRRKEGTRQLRLECNYDGHNWIYKLFNEQKIGHLITTNTFDNKENLPEGFIESLEKLPKKLKERHLYGSDADMEGQVWDEFSDARHIIEPFDVPNEWERIVCLDHGVTNPTAVLWAGVDYDGKVFVFDEHYEKEKPVSYHAEQIKKRDNSRVSDWLIDPACNSRTSWQNGSFYSVIDEYRDQGLNGFRPADNNVTAGLNRVNEYFKSDKLFITRNCINLINEVHGYKWARIKPGELKNEPDKPVKRHDHACDALRYIIMSRPLEPKKKDEKKIGTMEFFEKQQEFYSELKEAEVA